MTNLTKQEYGTILACVFLQVQVALNEKPHLFPTINEQYEPIYKRLVTIFDGTVEWRTTELLTIMEKILDSVEAEHTHPQPKSDAETSNDRAE